ncbi:PaaI family thioesterase [Mycolicibacter icosiumassiliensis]|uniref:PaaI family thioesterase n=1 Tax=Mycolicibacter icosiumassiliensis TaxID=1792835 RepID=UPI00082D2633|nr:PaaI family thioesterase [Mycolicibacter icosiumassiliensis]
MDSAEFARLVIANMPFAAALQIEIAELSPQEVRATMVWAPERCTTGGMLHGGALMAFADTVGAVCAVANLPQGASTSTIESKTNFFRAVREGSVTATSVPLHVGRTTIVVQTDLTDERDKLVARVTQTQAVLSPK